MGKIVKSTNKDGQVEYPVTLDKAVVCEYGGKKLTLAELIANFGDKLDVYDIDKVMSGEVFVPTNRPFDLSLDFNGIKHQTLHKRTFLWQDGVFRVDCLIHELTSKDIPLVGTVLATTEDMEYWMPYAVIVQPDEDTIGVNPIVDIQDESIIEYIKDVWRQIIHPNQSAAKVAKEEPVIFGRCIPKQPLAGKRYFFRDSIKIKACIDYDYDKQDMKGFGWSYAINDSCYKSSVEGCVIVTIPKDFDMEKFVTDKAYRDSLLTKTDGNIEHTAAPYWKIIDGVPKFTKLAAPTIENVNSSMFTYRCLKQRSTRHPGEDKPITRSRRCRLSLGYAAMCYSTNGRQRHRIFSTGEDGSITCKVKSINPAQVYYLHNRKGIKIQK